MSSSYREELNRWLYSVNLNWWHSISYNIFMRKTGKIINCNRCGKKVYKKLSQLNMHELHFCSRKCRLNDYNEQNEPWNKGTTGIMKPNSGSFKSGQRASINTEFKAKKHTFTGTLSEYKYIHYKVGVLFGKPKQCEGCGKDGLIGRQIHWANITGIYDTSRKNWKRLCAKCHAVFDDRIPHAKLV